ncbi:hypothetical protein ACIGT4_16360 [Streptomyces sioyaensis]|uniref:hypothetical protein n=1 Tax=Streptomyces sioyaensis TaxID=67364 RepID=UPI0037D40A2B
MHSPSAALGQVDGDSRAGREGFKGRKPYGKIVGLAETMADVLAEFPASALTGDSP